MHLYILIRDEDDVNWDESAGFVVRAASSKHARQLAAERAGDEGGEVWLNTSLSACKQIRLDAEAGVLLRDFKAG